MPPALFFFRVALSMLVAVQSLTRVWLSVTPVDFSTPGFPVLHYIPEFAQMYVHLADDAIQPSHPLSPLFSCPQSFPASGFFQWVSSLHQVAKLLKYWSFSFSISPSNEYSGLIAFRMDWLDLLGIQGILKSLLQHHTVQKHQFFGAQLSLQSNSYIHTWLLEKP